MRRVIVTLACCLFLAGCAAKPQPTAEVVVSAAASLTDALREIQSGFEAEHKSVRLKFNFGSSGALSQQIEQGAPVDLFISAATGPMDALVKRNLVENVTTLATNKVVLIRPGAAGVAAWADLGSNAVKRVAIGNPQHVPAGQYAKAVLEKLNLWAAVEGRLVLAEDVRQVLHYVESGEVQAGIVYRTDAATSQKVVVVAEAPPGTHAPVVYPMAVLKESKNAEGAKAFAAYLGTEPARSVLKKYGFAE